MKCVLLIPCYNEEETLARTLASLPRSLAGVEKLIWILADDGSTDRSREIASECGVDEILDLPHRGLARTYMAGLDRALELGADILVSTDADNQYEAQDIPLLLNPVLEGRADLVVGARPIESVAEFSFLKKKLSRLGSYVVRRLSQTEIEDAPSGFRAMNRNLMMRLHLLNNYTYTLEMILQAGRHRLRVLSVPVRVNPVKRPSRLMKGPLEYILKSALILINLIFIYRPAPFFFYLGLIPVVGGSALCLRWVILFFMETTRTHVPSLIAASILLSIGALLWVLGALAELLWVNRHHLEDIQFRLKKLQYEKSG